MSVQAAMTTRDVLCLSDDPDLSEALRARLAREGYVARASPGGVQALRAAAKAPPHLLLLDAGPLDAPGLALCGRGRATLRVPIIVLTTQQDDEAISACFAAGVEDCLARPLNMDVLLCRVRNVLQRTYAGAAPAPAPRTYRLGDGAFDPQFNEIVNGPVRVSLTPMEGKLLSLLLAHAGQVLPTASLMQRLWGYSSDVQPGVIKSHVWRLRIKLARIAGAAELLQAVPGVGYTLRQEQQGAGPSPAEPASRAR